MAPTPSRVTSSPARAVAGCRLSASRCALRGHWKPQGTSASVPAAYVFAHHGGAQSARDILARQGPWLAEVGCTKISLWGLPGDPACNGVNALAKGGLAQSNLADPSRFKTHAWSHTDFPSSNAQGST